MGWEAATMQNVGKKCAPSRMRRAAVSGSQTAREFVPTAQLAVSLNIWMRKFV